MKKFLIVLCTVCLIFTLTIPAFAEESSSNTRLYFGHELVDIQPDYDIDASNRYWFILKNNTTGVYWLYKSTDYVFFRERDGVYQFYEPSLTEDYVDIYEINKNEVKYLKRHVIERGSYLDYGGKDISFIWSSFSVFDENGQNIRTGDIDFGYVDGEVSSGYPFGPSLPLDTPANGTLNNNPLIPPLESWELSQYVNTLTGDSMNNNFVSSFANVATVLLSVGVLILGSFVVLKLIGKRSLINR